MTHELVTLAHLEGRETGERKDGRERRKRSIPEKLRERFLEVLDDHHKQILVYVTREGKIRQDVAQVQEELSTDKNFKDNESVDLNDLLAEGDDVDVLARSEIRKRRRELPDEDADFDGVDEDEESPAPAPALADHDDEYQPSEQDEEDEEDDDEETEDEAEAEEEAEAEAEEEEEEDDEEVSE